MARVLALDVGAKRCGIATTDELQLIATPLATIATHTLPSWLAQHLHSHQVELVLVGMPIDSYGHSTQGTQHAKGVLTLLRKHFPQLPLRTVDERLTSRMAQHAIAHSGLGKKARQEKGRVDQLAATIILQDYLESKAYNTRQQP